MNLKRKYDGGQARVSSERSKRSCLVEDEEKFYVNLAAEVDRAWRKRHTENHLYAVWTRISNTVCNSITPENYPRFTISSTPQYPLIPEPEDSKVCEEYEPVKGVVLPVPSQVPDFARTLESKVEEILVDVTEIKRLDIPEHWSTEEARRKAGNAIQSHLFQVYKTAMTAFIHNPTWERVYATLVVGVYFTQFYWEREDIPDLCPPVEFGYFREIPHARLSSSDLILLDDYVKYAIKECESRSMPKILCWNEPMFVFGEPSADDPETPSVVLTPQFLWSMRQPLKRYPSTRYQYSWVSAPQRRPEGIDDEAIREGYDMVEAQLKDIPAGSLKKFMEGLSKTPTASPASVEEGSSKVSEFTLSEYLENRRRMELEKSPIPTRRTTRSQTRMLSPQAVALGNLLPQVDEDQEEVSSGSTGILPMGDLTQSPGPGSDD